MSYLIEHASALRDLGAASLGISFAIMVVAFAVVCVAYCIKAIVKHDDCNEEEGK